MAGSQQLQLLWAVLVSWFESNETGPGTAVNLQQGEGSLMHVGGGEGLHRWSELLIERSQTSQGGC